MPKHKILLLFFIMHPGLISFAQPMDWVSLPQEFGIPVKSLVVYQNELIAAGNTIKCSCNIINIKPLSPGIYFCTLSNEEYSFTQKIIINR